MGIFHALKKYILNNPRKSSRGIYRPSGCGKSTFLRLFNRMNDLIPNTRLTGNISIDGQDIYDKSVEVDVLRRNVGMVFQRPNPFPKSIFENVAYGLRVNGVKDKELHFTQSGRSLERCRFMGRGERQVERVGLCSLGGPTTTFVHSPGHGRVTIGSADGRTASALDPISTAKIEELIWRIMQANNDCHRYPQHATSRSRQPQNSIFLLRRNGRI